MTNKKQEDLTVVILAAGKGSRMQSKTYKPMKKIGGYPMIDHVLSSASKLSPKQIISVISQDMEGFQNYIGDRSDIAYQKEQLGSAHALYAAKEEYKLQNGVTIVLFADTPLIRPQTIDQLVRKISYENSDICVLGFEKYENNRYGKLVINNAGQLTNIVEHGDATQGEKDIVLCNSGVMVIKTDILWNLIEKIDNNNSQKEYYLTDIIKVANEHNYLCSYIIEEEKYLQGANTKKELVELEKTFQSLKREEFLEQGVQLLDDNNTYFSFDTKIESDVIIYPNVHILPGSEVKKGSIIYPFTIIEGAIIGENSTIGPYARLRPQTKLEGNNKVGNFVEIKKSDIKENVKINHLSYIGDTTIDCNTNIGAGTITCNYDGKNKYETKIGRDCFIGSNSSLVAPVIIHDNATIGAGSVITKDVEKNTLSLTRSKQVSLNNVIKKRVLD